MPDDDDYLDPGAILAHRYTIIEFIAEGGMASVYRAKDGMTGQEVALKRAATDAPPEDLKRFREEAALLQRIDHPNVIGILGVHTDSERPFYAMELARARLDERRGMLAQNLREGIAAFLQLCEGVRGIHAHVEAHRDISNRNALLVGDRWVVSDLGLAKPHERSTKLTRTGERFGTPLYMAPEQRADASLVDKRSDVYALGKLLLEIVTGEDPTYPDEHRIGTALFRLIARATAEDPAKRYQTVEDLILDLVRFDLSDEDRVPRDTRAVSRNDVVSMPTPDIRVHVNHVVIYPTLNRKKDKGILQVTVQNHSPWAYYHASFAFELGNGRSVMWMRDPITLETNAAKEIAPGNSFSLHVPARALMKDGATPPVRAVSTDRIGRRFAASEAETARAFKSALADHDE